MPAKNTTGGITAAEVDAKLPRSMFVRRGHIHFAFGLSKEEVSALIAQGIFVAKYPFGKTRNIGSRTTKNRAHFLRSQVLAIARAWEAAS